MARPAIEEVSAEYNIHTTMHAELRGAIWLIWSISHGTSHVINLLQIAWNGLPVSSVPCAEYPTHLLQDQWYTFPEVPNACVGPTILGGVQSPSGSRCASDLTLLCNSACKDERFPMPAEKASQAAMARITGGRHSFCNSGAVNGNTIARSVPAPVMASHSPGPRSMPADV